MSRSDRKWFTPQRNVAAVFVLDGFVSVGFGVSSLFAPRSTFGTIVALGNAADDSLLLAALASISGLYVLIGLVCWICAATPAPYKSYFAAVMALGHGWAAAKGYGEIGRGWLIGDPWPDIAIHSLFVVAYASFGWRALRQRA